MNWTILKNEIDYNRAISRLDEIFDSKRKDSTFDEAELLILLIDKYEIETEPEIPNPDPIEYVKYKMVQRNLRNKDIGEIVGGKSKASEILNRKRRLTLSMIRKLNKELGISAETLIKEYELVK